MMPTAGLPLLLVDQLGFSYETFGRKVEILENVSFKIDRGDYVAIQGPSGSGKSTLFYILGCLLRPSTGRILFDGTDLSQLSDDQASLIRNQHIGFIFQQFHLLPRASVLDNILLPGSYPAELVLPRSAQKAKALAIAERLGLSQHLQHTPNQLSGGQQQRVAIVRALAMQPELMLFDEVTSALDPELVGEVLDVIRDLKDTGMTILMATHEMGFARDIADQVCFLDAGRVLESGPPEQVLGDPVEPRTREFLARVLG